MKVGVQVVFVLLLLNPLK